MAVGTSVPVNLPNETANLRFRIRRFAMTQYLQLGGSSSDNSKSSRIFNVQHKVKYKSDRYRFADTNFNAPYYGILATDDRGLRVVLNEDTWENFIGFSTLKTENGEAVASTLGDIKVGLSHQFARFDGEGYQDSFNLSLIHI